MRALVIGATGATGSLLVDALLDAGHQVRALARDPERAVPLAERGVEVVPGDLTGDGVLEATAGMDGVVFCAGSGAATGKDLTLLVDLHGAIRSIDAATAQGVGRYVMLSSMAADDPLRGGVRAISPYLAAKHAADRMLATSGLGWTIVRPGRLTDEAGSGKVHVGQPRIPEDQRGRRTICREDVARVLLACLNADTAIGATFEVLRGEVEIPRAVADLVPCPPGDGGVRPSEPTAD